MKKQRKHADAARCAGCPYPSTGFLCSGSDGECMKTRMQKIKNTATKGDEERVCHSDGTQ